MYSIGAECLFSLKVAIQQLAARMTANKYSNVTVRAALGGCFLLVLHGLGSFFVLLHAWLFYTLARMLAGKAILVPMVWGAAAVCIVVTDKRMLPEDSTHFGTLLGPSAAFLDAEPFCGIYHWSHSVKLMLLRSMSFVFDWHRALCSGAWGSSLDVITSGIPD